MPVSKENVTNQIVVYLFQSRYRKGIDYIPFSRDDIIHAAESLKLPVPKNLGVVAYTFKNTDLHEIITKTTPKNKHWWILQTGKGKYCFKLNPPPLR